MNAQAKAKVKSEEEAYPVKREILGLVLLLAAIVVGGSLISFHPSDQLLWNVTGSLERPHNLLGAVGAHLAGALFLLIGFSSFWLVFVLLVTAFFAFSGRSYTSPVKSTVAFITLIISFCGLLNLQLPEVVDFKDGEIIAGGLVGLHLAGLAESVLNYFGAYVLLAAAFLISLMMALQFSLGRLFARLVLWLLWVFRKIREGFTKKRERKLRAKKTSQAREHIKSKPKVKIVDPAPQPPRKAEQEQFPFMEVPGKFKLPKLDLLEDPPARRDREVHKETLEMNARRVERKLADFAVQGEVTEILPGPVITMYEFKPAPGVKISKVAGLSDDLALALRAPGIRIVAPIPGKAAIGIEIPNVHREMVYFKEILSSPSFQESRHKLPIALGKDITGNPVVEDLASMPHLLVAGATGAGKSVSLNTMINSLLFKVTPDMVRFLIIDPKRIELAVYHDIPNLLHPVVTHPKEATKALKWAVNEMERRYMLLSDRGVRNIDTYNKKILKEQKKDKSREDERPDKTLPYIIIVIDELADLMMASSKEVEGSITRLAQMARAAGIHIIIATQRPSVDVLTGLIKANFPARISFQVSSRVDSRTILDAMGAESLLGEGDMLFMPPKIGRMMRIHGAFISEEEVNGVTDFLRKQMRPDYDESIVSKIAEDEGEETGDIEKDEKYEEAVDVVIKSGQASISMLQRKLRVGYNRAARMIEAMEADGIVGPSDGVRPREVYGRDGS